MIKNLCNTVLITQLLMLGLCTTVKPVFAESIEFKCEKRKEVPVTIVVNSGGKKVPMISWNRSIAKIKPQERCEIVSNRMQKAYNNLNLKFITNGLINGQKVICGAKVAGGDCVELLFTLQVGDDPKEILKQLGNYRAKGPLQQAGDGTPIFYIDVDLFLQDVIK